MSQAVVDASVIQYLYQLGLLDLLRSMFEVPVLVPVVVVEELERGRQQGCDLPAIARLAWTEVCEADLSRLPSGLTLDAGERAVLAVGLTLVDGLVLVDDLAARRAADRLGLAYTGVLGVLVTAKERGLIDRLRPYLDRLTRLGFRLAPSLHGEVLRQVGE